MDQEFLLKQRKRIQTRIRTTSALIVDKRQDADFKAVRVLPALKIALSRTFNGTYGICIDCGKEIPHARLLHTPGVIRCLDCQATHEK